MGERGIISYTFLRALGHPHDQGRTIMMDIHLPRTIAGYACPTCPHCDKEYRPEVANTGPVQCDECGKWFEVTTQTVYQSEEKPDYKAPAAQAAKTPRAKSKTARQGDRRARNVKPK